MPPSARVPPLSKARLEALTDGIFAVTMTLLVLELKFPEPAAGQTLFEALAGLVDRLDNYVISFVVLAVFWLGHLRLFRRCGDPDAGFVAVNLAFLLFTTLVPPLTKLVGENPHLPRAAVLYGGNLVLVLVCEAILWWRVCHGLSNDTLADPKATWLLVRKRYALAVGVVLAGVVAALLEIALRASAGFSPWVYLLLIGAGVVRPPLRGVPRA
jgi:uncharacterized membrane protein